MREEHLRNDRSTGVKARDWLNWPNRISITRILLIIPLLICLLNLNAGWPHVRHITLGLFVLMAGSDWLDGFLARKLKQETALGKFLDPIGDKLLITVSVVLLAIEPTSVTGFTLPNWVPVILVGKDVITILGFVLIYFLTETYFVSPRILGKLCTAMEAVMVAGVLVAPDLPIALQRAIPVMWWLVCASAVLALADYLRLGARYAAQHEKSQEGTSRDDA